MSEKGSQHTSWLQAWEASPTPAWAMKGVNPYIEKFINDLCRGKQKAKIFFPMCGDVPDMYWVAKQGHEVVGVEISEIPVKKFFTDQNLQFDVTPCEQITGTLYKSKDGCIRVYCGDFFLFNSSIEDGFDGVWDRGSFNILDTCDSGDTTQLKKDYAQILKSVTTSDVCILLELVIFEDCVKVEEMENNFGSECKIEELGLMERYAPEYTDFPIKGFQFFKITKRVMS